MEIAAPSLFNFTDQLELRRVRVGRLQEVLAMNSDRINAAEDSTLTAEESQASETLVDFGRFHHAVGATLRVNQFIASEFLFDPIR